MQYSAAVEKNEVAYKWPNRKVLVLITFEKQAEKK